MSNKFVVGGGWSAGQFDQLDRLTKWGEVIGVNDSMWRIPCDIGLTMDRLWFENRFETIRQRDMFKAPLDNVWVREKCDCNIKQPKTWHTFTHYNRPYPTMEEGTLHGGNSGTCAINLALQTMLEGDRLFLFGFDMQKGPKGEPYWYPAYSWANPGGATKKGHFDQWRRDMHGFASWARTRNIMIYNVTCHSALDCFRKLSFKDFLGVVE